jgi:mannose-1-phosphate guanylyltransferase/mannose-6-phosphate isomerase
VPRDEVVLVTPADSLIDPSQSFINTVSAALRLAAKGKLVTLGVKPTKAETGYGYLKLGRAWEDGYIVEAFKEKPDEHLAREYVECGEYLWNSGIFAFQIDFLLNELANYAPSLYHYLSLPYNELVMRFNELPNISFDYAVAERSEQVVTVPLSCFWSDIGSWDAVFELLPKDGAGNATFGDCVSFGCKDTLLYAKNRLIAGINLEDILVIETADVVLIAKKGDSQKVKNLVEHLIICGRSEITEDNGFSR